MVAPSGEICGSAIHVNLNRSCSVMKRLVCAREPVASAMTARATMNVRHGIVCSNAKREGTGGLGTKGLGTGHNRDRGQTRPPAKPKSEARRLSLLVSESLVP